jgi:hypothetical protein
MGNIDYDEFPSWIRFSYHAPIDIDEFEPDEYDSWAVFFILDAAAFGSREFVPCEPGYGFVRHGVDTALPLNWTYG